MGSRVAGDGLPGCVPHGGPQCSLVAPFPSPSSRSPSLPSPAAPPTIRFRRPASTLPRRGAPTNLIAEDRAGSLVLSWDASSDADVVGYDVYRYAPDPARENSYVKVNTGLVAGTEFVIADAASSPSWYRVKAVDAGSNASSASGALAAAKPSIGSSDNELRDPSVSQSTRP
jgi:hypothetical protein